jgi:hypothetical protein
MNRSLAAVHRPAQMPEGQPDPCLFSHVRNGGYPVTPHNHPYFQGFALLSKSRRTQQSRSSPGKLPPPRVDR